jgi:two-component system, cell cycle response regulator
MAISRAQGEALPMETPASAEDQLRRKAGHRPLERLGEWRRNLAAEIRLIDWRAVAAPTAFALLAIGLLIYDHVQERIEGPLYWLTLGLIVTIFMWMVDTNRRRAMMIAWHAKGALQDNLTGLGNRSKLWNDMTVGLSMPRERRVLALLDLDGLEAHREHEGYAAGDALLSRVATKLAETVRGMNGAAYRIEGSQFAVLVSSTEQEPAEIMVVAGAALAEHDDGLVEVSYGGVALPDEANAPETAFELASQRLRARTQRQRRSASRQAHAVLLAVLSARRPDLRDHVRNVSFRVLAVGRRLGIDEDDLDDIVRAGQLQDIGLLAVPEGVLESERRLSDEERRMINRHTEAGERIIAEAPGLEAVARLVRSSGERYDGTGYPDGLRGEEIPLGSRIITACVAFAAMTAARPYRQPGYTTARALEELRADSGTHFDPAVVETLADDIEADR